MTSADAYRVMPAPAVE